MVMPECPVETGASSEGLAAESAEQATVMIDATYLKAHRTASSLRLKKGGVGV